MGPKNGGHWFLRGICHGYSRFLNPWVSFFGHGARQRTWWFPFLFSAVLGLGLDIIIVGNHGVYEKKARTSRSTRSIPRSYEQLHFI